MKLEFLTFCLQVWRISLKHQLSDGSMPAGHNGPYHDQETPVRNTSHYLIGFLFAWRQAGDTAFKNAAIKCLDYLLAEDCPYYTGYTFKHRQGGKKDMCNGLIGPAWSIEALLAASELPRGKEARDLAKKLFLLHPFDASLRLWNRVECDGRELSVDETFNHQLWFAACAAPLMSDTPEAKARIERFVDGLNDNWAISWNGRIIHPVWSSKRRWRERAKRIIKPAYRKHMISKEIGYHTFNLYALSMLHENGVHFSASIKQKCTRAMNYLKHAEFLRGIGTTPYAYPYNPPGWEIPYAVEHLKSNREFDDVLLRGWIQKQIDITYNSSTNAFDRNTPDSITLTARLYECARLSEITLNLSIGIETAELKS